MASGNQTPNSRKCVLALSALTSAKRDRLTTAASAARPAAVASALVTARVPARWKKTAVVIATHDLTLMDQFGYARRLVVGDGQLRIFEGD